MTKFFGNVLKNKKKMVALTIMALVVTAALSIGLVALNAYSSKLQYQINSINNETQASDYRIANLQVKIKTATNVANLEDRAIQMGLVYPGFSNIVYVKDTGAGVQDFATALKLNAYE